jgi:Flp pilus assembly protein TadD
MNSWHSWSPNGKWLVFSSKEFSPYTQLFLTHIDEQGHSTPAVLLEHFTDSDRAANIPEFVNTKATAIKKIQEEFLNDYSFVRAGNEFFRHGETDNAISEYREAMKLNPNNAEAHLKMGFLLYNAKSEYEQGMAHLSEAVRLAPTNPRAHHDLGMALLHQKKLDQAISHLSEAIRRMPQGLDKQYKAVNMHHNLGLALFYNRQFEESLTHLYRAVSLDPNNAKLHYDLAKSLAAQGKTAQSLSYLSKAVSLKPDIDRSPQLHELLAAAYAKAGQLRQAILSEEKALNLALDAGNQAHAQRIQQRLGAYKEEYLAQQLRQGLGPRK